MVGVNKLRISTGDKTEEDDDGDGDDEVKRLPELLEDDPKKLNDMDVEDVIYYFKVDDIVDMALKSGQGKANDDGDKVEESAFTVRPGCYGRVFTTLTTMVSHIEKIREFEFQIIHKYTPQQMFALLLLFALDSYKRRCTGPLKVDGWDKIPKLCAILPTKLLAHVLSEKASLSLLKSTSKETHKPRTPAQKKAAERCEICLGKGAHSGPDGCFCSFRASVPKGLAVGRKYWIICASCNTQKCHTVDCVLCGTEEGKAVPIPTLDLELL